MKKIYILLIMLMLTLNGAIAQWVPQNSGTAYNLNSVYFTNTNTGYAVGDGGTILKTNNGGTNWVLQNSGTISILYSVHFPNTDTGYAVGESGTILKTTDGGTNWTAKYLGNTGQWGGVFFTDVNTGYVVGTGIIKTIDGGTNWTGDSGGALLSNWAVHFPNKDTGYIVGTLFPLAPVGYVKRTTNGGIDWVDVYSYEVNYNLLGRLSVFFINTDTGYFTSEPFGTILKTTNGGTNWTDHNASGNSIFFTDASTGYVAGGNGTILKTIDAGANWTGQYSGTTAGLYSVHFPGVDTGYAVGDVGTILKTTNGGYPVGTNDLSSKSNRLKIYPNPSSDKVTIKTSAVPTKGQLYIMNISGQQLITRKITEPATQINIANLPGGVYFVRVTNGRTVEVGKVIKQ